jgi:hypothetical protein
MERRFKEDDVIVDILEELYHAQRTKGRPFNSAHEGYSVILEELDELWDEVRKKVRDKQRMNEECVQIAASAIRFILDVCKEDNGNRA